MLIGRPPADFDLATDARPEAVVALFGTTFAIPTGLKHGTVTVLSETRRPVEVTTFRGEGEYLDGRRPVSVTYVDTLEEDLSRRDFTMNAVAFDPLDGRLSDPFDGQGDLARRLIRAVGDPLVRFREDGLRPLRAVRQAAQLEFEVDPPTREAIPPTLEVFRKVSAERIRDELFKMLGARQPSRGLELMRQTGLLGEVIPELLEGVGCTPESISQARRLRPHVVGGGCHPGRRGRAAGRAPARRRQAARPPAARGRARRVQLLQARVRRRRDGRRDLPAPQAGQRRSRPGGGDGEEPHVLLHGGLVGRHDPSFRPAGGRSRRVGRSVRAARRGRQGAWVRRGSQRGAGRAARAASPSSPTPTRR